MANRSHDETTMQQQSPPEKEDGTDAQTGEGGTYKTDISETDDEGTTVREGEVREDDMEEIDPSTPPSEQKKS
jgi:hypothetical protein